MTDTKEPVLNRQDRDSVAWLKLKKHLEAQLQKCRIANDGHMDEQRRARLGGRIEEIKAILALDSDVPPVQDENANFRD